MQNRLCGREQEFGISMNPLPQLDGEDLAEWYDDILDQLLSQVPNAVPALEAENDYWLSNGARMYIDLSHIEVATAEYRACSYDGIAQEKASELILLRAAQLFLKRGLVKSISFYKNNVGSESNVSLYKEITYGSHHNYAYRLASQSPVFLLMSNFIPASLPLSGNGHIFRLSKRKAVYCFSQRANHISRRYAEDTRSRRAIVNSRDESLMHDAAGLGRLHMIARDATRCEFQTWLVDSMTHLVLRLAEESWMLPKKLLLHYPVGELHRINFRTDTQYRIRSADRQISLLDYNALFLNAAKQLSPLSPEEKKCLEEWERVLGLLKAKAYDQLIGELDWVTKWYLLKNRMRKEGFGLNDFRAWKINTYYHDISILPSRSWFARLDEQGYIRHLITKADIQRAMTRPPETRAKSRGLFIRRCLRDRSYRRRLEMMNWERATTEKSYIYFGLRSDPFSTRTEIVSKDEEGEPYL